MDEDDLYDSQMDSQLAGQMLAKLTQQYTGLEQQEGTARAVIERSRAERLREAEEKIRAARFGMPLPSEQMFALSSALLSPRPYRGIAGTLSNVVPVLGDISGARRESEDARAAALAKLQSGYADVSAEGDLAQLQDRRKGLMDLMKVYGPLAKPKDRRTGFNPVTGRLQYMDTAEEVQSPSEMIARVPPAAINTLKTYLANPAANAESKRQAIKNFETRFGVPSRLVLEAQ